MRLLALPSALLALLPALCNISPVRADVKFTQPAAGAEVEVGTIDVAWEESGIAPPMTSLLAYTLVLVTGGNDVNKDMLSLATFVTQGNFHAGNNASGTIPAGIAEASKDGFFFKMISSSSTGSTVINYSDRFSIKGLTGYTAPLYLNAVKALDGSTAGPQNAGEAISSSVSSTSSPTTTASLSVATQRPITATVTSVSGAQAPQSSSSDSSIHQARGMSKGALIGIAIACAVFGLSSLAVALWVCFKRRKQRRSQLVDMKLQESGSDSDDSLRREMSMVPVELDPSARIVEADSARIIEAGDGQRRPELDHMTARAELEGDVAHYQDPETPLTPIPATPVDCLTLESSAVPTLLAHGRAYMPNDNV